MKITKFTHSCLLVEMPEPVNRTALFDPGMMSAELLANHDFAYLDDIFITHEHPDHFDSETVKRLTSQFPDVRVTAPQAVVDMLADSGIRASAQPPEGARLFSAPHEAGDPLFSAPEQAPVHYLDMLTHPGDSHSFHETKPILALPVTAPWGATTRALNLTIELKPSYVLPIHDWHWSDAARRQMYDGMSDALAKENITFIKLTDGDPVVLEV